jgi:hypothetical protein
MRYIVLKIKIMARLPVVGLVYMRKLSYPHPVKP